MLILACDTSNTSCSACLATESDVLASSFISIGLTHSQTFMPMVHDLMEKADMSYDKLDAMACTVGPGSFTGIRIGVSAIKTMAMAAGKPAIPVSSLKSLAYPLFSYPGLVVPMIDARNHRAFFAAYYHGREVIPEGVRSVDEIVQLCDDWRDHNAAGESIITCGNACKLYTDAHDNHRDDVIFATGFTEIDAKNVAALAMESIFDMKDAREQLGETFAPTALMPVYRTSAQAERLSKEKGDEKKDIPIQYYKA
ncbi:MAG TPA: tRNA (adenosine(37)-N6)-threonylcarbamoyltransferase complex dimerization subunit type 1 TsaB [Bacillota bacterium]|nr:tRNA (adenosine(37)-N6)-threonylcarbamoyltransferase complex dimerization subunit type 1 TsaB [Bacillota bacterium]HPE38670.1 tRNA (adenosine(37)-N6)-threonylcarbamoyltransferase complex dimerization subunit type 1 TsaB [Bacillota bacterium]